MKKNSERPTSQDGLIRIGERPKSQDILIDQVKDFFADCDSDSYTYVRVYSANKLMRVLEQPYYWDIIGQFQLLFEKILMTNDILYGSKQQINRSNIQEMEQLVNQELTEQALTFSWAKIEKHIAAVDMKKIRKEYVMFLREQKREEVEISWRSQNKDQIVINPYEYLHNTH